MRMLKVERTYKMYSGGLKAIDDFSMWLRKENALEIPSGPNGAGKTTLFNAIGVYKYDGRKSAAWAGKKIGKTAV